MSRRSAFSNAARSTRDAKKRFDAWVMRLAALVGWAGVIALCVLAPLSLAGKLGKSGEAWLVGALMAASLIGWRNVNEGQNALARKLGQGALAAMLFFVLPLGCGAAELFEARLAQVLGFAPPDHPFWLTVRWYPPLVVLACALTFLKRQALPRTRVHFWRGLGAVALLVPYALLFAYLVLHVRVEALEGPLHETLSSTGRYSIIVQLLLMYFVGSAA